MQSYEYQKLTEVSASFLSIKPKILKKTTRDPSEVAKVVCEALSILNPGKTYYVNVSLLYRLLSFIPAGFREKMMLRKIKKWM